MKKILPPSIALIFLLTSNLVFAAYDLTGIYTARKAANAMILTPGQSHSWDAVGVYNGTDGKNHSWKANCKTKGKQLTCLYNHTENADNKGVMELTMDGSSLTGPIKSNDGKFTIKKTEWKKIDLRKKK